MKRNKRFRSYDRYQTYRKRRNQQANEWPVLTLVHKIIISALILLLAIVPVILKDTWFGNSRAYLEKIFLSHLTFEEIQEVTGRLFEKKEVPKPVTSDESEQPYTLNEIPPLSLPVIGQLAEENDSGEGVMITAPEGYPVVAVLSGKVKAVREVAQGMEVEVDHGRELSTIYSSLKAVAVKPNDEVQKGTVVGYTGTINGTGGVHFYAKLKDTVVDTRDLIAGK